MFLVLTSLEELQKLLGKLFFWEAPMVAYVLCSRISGEPSQRVEVVGPNGGVIDAPARKEIIAARASLGPSGGGSQR